MRRALRSSPGSRARVRSHAPWPAAAVHTGAQTRRARPPPGPRTTVTGAARPRVVLHRPQPQGGPGAPGRGPPPPTRPASARGGEGPHRDERGGPAHERSARPYHPRARPCLALPPSDAAPRPARPGPSPTRRDLDPARRGPGPPSPRAPRPRREGCAPEALTRGPRD